MSTHSLRKFATTRLQAGGVPEPWISIIQGRRINDSRDPYTQPSNRQLLEAYERAYPSLAIFEGSESEIARLRAEVEDLQRFKDAWKLELEEMQKMRRKIRGEEQYPSNEYD